MRCAISAYLALSIAAVSFFSTPVHADCYESRILSPSPFMGNNGEIFKLADGSLLWVPEILAALFRKFWPV